MIGAVTQQIDLAQLLVVAFVIFFFGLLYYLRREDKREGYPLEEPIPTLGHGIVGFPINPPPKIYKRLEGGIGVMPHEYERRELPARPRAFYPGAPLYPVGEPLTAGIGPGAYTLRRDTPFHMLDGSPQLEPLREATEYVCVDPHYDPRGRRVVGADLKEAGHVVDIWVDKGSKILRYVEIALASDGSRRLVPIFSVKVSRNTSFITIEDIKAAQLSLAPMLKEEDTITAREEDFVNAFFAGGTLYASPARDALL